MRSIALLLFSLSLTCFAGEPLKIRVEKAKWNAVPEDIRRVCLSSANTMWQHVPDEKLDPISVWQSKQGPIVLYKRGKGGSYRVGLDVNGTYWSQVGYQFAHEFCHILCRYRADRNPHKWFEESLCETASLFALRQMAETWKNKPPYSNWKDFHRSHATYAEDRIKEARQSEDKTLAKWYRERKPRFNTDEYTRTIEHEAAIYLLPYFEEDPTRWAALQTLYAPQGPPPESFTGLLKAWRNRAPEKHKGFVEELAKAFELTI